jgi:hypothetical protein
MAPTSRSAAADDFDPNDPVFVSMKPPRGVEGLTEGGTYPKAPREAFETVWKDKGWTEVKDSDTTDPSPALTPTDTKN